MKCKFCKANEELKWPENYKKGDRPVNAETGAKHICKEDDSGFLDIIALVATMQSTLTDDSNQNMGGLANNAVKGLACNLCNTPLINCGCANCNYLGAIFCPTCEIHPGGKRAD